MQSESLPSLQSLVPDRFREAVEQIPDDLINKPEEYIVENVYGSWSNIPDLDVDLRRNFWKHYSVALATEEPILAIRLYENICSMNYFYNLLKEPKRVAFIICESVNDKIKAQYLLFLSWPRMKKILSQEPSINPKTGQPDTKLMELQFKLFQYLDARQNGSIIQKHQHDVNQKTLQVNVNAEQQSVTSMTPQEIDKRLEELRGKVSLPPAQAQPEIMDSISHVEKILATNNRTVTDSKKGI